MTCYNCKQPILENEAYKQIPSGCPDGPKEDGTQCTVYHSAPVHVDVGTGDTDCIKPLSKIEQLEKRIEELEKTVTMLHHQAEGAALRNLEIDRGIK